MRALENLKTLIKKRDVEELMKFLKENVSELVRELLSMNNPKALVLVSEAIGKTLAEKGVSSSRIRNIFGYVKKLDFEITNPKGEISQDIQGIIHRLMLLSPKLAYTIGRTRRSGEKDALKLLKSYFDSIVDEMGSDKKRFKAFIDFFESILAYHKYYGGK